MRASLRRANRLPDAAAFGRWQREMDTVLEMFIHRYALQVAGRLDLSPASLNPLEAWLLCHIGGTIGIEKEDPLRQSLAIYVGEVFRRNLGGTWTVAFHAADPQVRGLPLVNCPPACCPLLLIDEALRKRTGFTLHASFEYFRKRHQRCAADSTVAPIASTAPASDPAADADTVEDVAP